MVQSALVLAGVVTLAVILSGVSTVKIESQTLGPHDYSRMQAKESWDWSRDKDGHYDLANNFKYILTRYYHIETVMKTLCEKVGLDTCQPYFTRIRANLNKTLDSAGDAIMFFDHYILKIRKEQNERRNKNKRG